MIKLVQLEDAMSCLEFEFALKSRMEDREGLMCCTKATGVENCQSGTPKTFEKSYR